MKTPLNGAALKQHFTYSWWKYLIIGLLVFGLVDIIFTVTAYRVPPEKKVEFYIYGYMDLSGTLQEYMDSVRENEMPEMEEMTCMTLASDNMYGPMQLMTYLAAGEGDVYLLSREEFLSNAASGSLIPLENDAELMAVFTKAGASLQSGWRRNTETGESHLYGIPQDRLPGLARYAVADDGFLCVIVNNGNDENVLKFMRILCRDMITAPDPEPSPSPLPEPAA